MSVRAVDAAELLSPATARRLRAAGLRWDPTAGDRFVLADRDMDDDVFVVSDMVADVHDFPSGRVIGFNGTVEWALDSVGSEQALWLPHEDQLRRLLGGTFRRLERVPDGTDGTDGTEATDATDDPAWRVTVRLPGDGDDSAVGGATAVEAYAGALLALLARATG
ncbi:pilus assembly protein CpaE [Aquipuribacter sp. SD81]|uniref:pilus assembly protein CpaE n=1 Tax=Aquipuribacter sp. SD81 TaxID=3127703 RepID=UPI00301B5C6D